jgi:hypothetical protein
MIVEGPDGAGKTTLAKKLAEFYGLEYRRPPEEVLSSTHGPQEGLAEWWDEQLARPPSDLAVAVYDRCFYISDPIYQQAIPSRLLSIDSPDLARGIMRLWNVEPYLIFCLPPWSNQLANVMRHDRDRLLGVTAEALLKINNAYWAYWAMWSQSLYDNVAKYDYTEEDSWSRLIDYLEAAA